VLDASACRKRSKIWGRKAGSMPYKALFMPTILVNSLPAYGRELP